MAGLFAGDGGFELAATWAGIIPIWSNEINERCCSVLRKHFRHRVINADVRDCGKNKSYELEQVELICGGDPCQPHSFAGLRKGQADDRYLWPEKIRIIRELLPAWVVNENVYGSISNGILDLKIDDLESTGYTCQAYCLPAEAVGALHQRERVWIVAHNPNGYRDSEIPGNIPESEKEKRPLEGQQHEIYQLGEPVDLWDYSTYLNTERFKEQHLSTFAGICKEGISGYFGFGPYPHGNIPREVIKSSLVGMLNGLPEGMEYADRNQRIAEMGNAIVPQLGYEILKSIKIIHESTV